jgi:hypothetical protein
VSHLVYLDAFVPFNGQSVDDMLGVTRSSFGLNEPWLVPPLPRTYEDPVEGEFAMKRRGGQPIRCFVEPVRLLSPLEQFEFSRTYIKATGEARPVESHPFWEASDRVKDDPRWRYREIETNHMVPSNRPEELAALLLELT